MRRRLASSVVSGVSGACLLATVLVAPWGFWRIPLALVAMFWAPGHSLVALALRSRESRPIELHALAIGSSIVLAPLVGLATSLTIGFTHAGVAAAYTLLDAALALVAVRAAPTLPADPRRAFAPSPRATAVIVAVTLVVVGVVAAKPLLDPRDVPLSLALLPPDGGDLGNLSVMPDAGDRYVVRWQLRAGDAPDEGRLVATLSRADVGGATQLLHDEPVALRARESAEGLLVTEALQEGTYKLSVEWKGGEARETHLWLHVIREEAPS